MGSYMNFFNENEKISNFELSLNKKLSKTEKSFIRLILQNYKESRVEISKTKLKTLICSCFCDDLKSYLDKLLQIRVSYSFNNSENYRYDGSFNIIDSYFMQKEKVVFYISQNTLFLSEKTTIFNGFNLKTIFDFESSSSLPMYLKFVNFEENGEENYMDFQLEEFKEFLEITNCYERFYDFEKKVLEPIINDLNTYSEFHSTYEKLKKSSTASSKITGIRIKFYSRKSKEIKNQTNELMNIVKMKINDFDRIYHTIFYYLKNYDYSYVSDNINFVLQKRENKNFDNNLIKALENNFGHIHVKIEEYNNSIFVEKLLNNTYELHSELYKAMQKLQTDKISDNHMFLSSFISKIYQMKDGEDYIIEKNGIKIELQYNKNKKSRIEINMS